MEAVNDRRIASAALFTTLLDFADVGDISVFIDEDQLKLADEHMNRLGYLEGRHMAEAFNLLRENDLIWFFVINNFCWGVILQHSICSIGIPIRPACRQRCSLFIFATCIIRTC